MNAAGSTSAHSIAVLYICTGIYSRFWRDFYSSAEKYLCRGTAKHYFVWTDSEDIAHTFGNSPNITVSHMECHGFPQDSLYRFHTFLQHEAEISRHDLVAFFNANTLFLQPVELDELFGNEPLCAGVWPPKHFYASWPLYLNYERNPRSTAYIAPFGRQYRYYMGCINGGHTQAYLEMVHTLANNIDADAACGIVACVHDESHLNAYLRNRQPDVHVIPRRCAWPDGFLHPPSQPALLFVDKYRLDPVAFSKESHSPGTRIAKALKVVFLRPVTWLLSSIR